LGGLAGASEPGSSLMMLLVHRTGALPVLTRSFFLVFSLVPCVSTEPRRRRTRALRRRRRLVSIVALVPPRARATAHWSGGPGVWSLNCGAVPCRVACCWCAQCQHRTAPHASATTTRRSLSRSGTGHVFFPSIAFPTSNQLTRCHDNGSSDVAMLELIAVPFQ